jgi:hypothetical protein
VHGSHLGGAQGIVYVNFVFSAKSTEFQNLKASKIYTYEMHACGIYTLLRRRELRKVSTSANLQNQYMPMRYMPMRCIPMRCTPTTYTVRGTKSLFN